MISDRLVTFLPRVIERGWAASSWCDGSFLEHQKGKDAKLDTSMMASIVTSTLNIMLFSSWSLHDSISHSLVVWYYPLFRLKVHGRSSGPAANTDSRDPMRMDLTSPWWWWWQLAAKPSASISQQEELESTCCCCCCCCCSSEAGVFQYCTWFHSTGIFSVKVESEVRAYH
jgi:hypothetical protein